MIKLNKQPEPDVLARNKDKWTKKLMSYVNADQTIPDHVQNKYNNDDVRSVLKDETNGGKCMYCESPIGAVASEHIEHYKPKSIYPELTFDWNNLGLSCPKCNMKKKDIFNENCTYINPYTDLPDDHFVFLGAIIHHTPNNKRARHTIDQLDLNRLELVEARKDRNDKILSLIDLYAAEDDPTSKGILKKNIEKEIMENKPYSMCTNTVYKKMIPFVG